MKPLAAIFALLVAAAGWFYMFYSRGAQNLAGIEQQRINAKRTTLRRVGGLVMMALAVCFFAGFYSVSWEEPTAAFLTVWLLVLALLATIVMLALLDLRLTWKLRRNRVTKGPSIER